MERLILIKLGGSVITDKSKPFFARERVIRRLGREIVKAKLKYQGKLLVAHGSGSFGHVKAAKYKTQLGLTGGSSLEGFVQTSNIAVAINRIVISNLIKEDLKVVSFAPGSFILAKNHKLYRAFPGPIVECIKIGAIPVVYGDVVMDIERGFCIYSAEKVLNTLITRLTKDYKVERIIHCGKTDGVYDDKGKTIKKITTNNFAIVRNQIKGSEEIDVTGGMLHKVEESLAVAKKGISTFIINGDRRGELQRAITGKRHFGTHISL